MTVGEVLGIVLGVVLGAGLGALAWFFRASKYGLAMRATAFNQQVAQSLGISVKNVFAMAWAISAVIFSWIWKRRAKPCTTRASLEMPTTRFDGR